MTKKRLVISLYVIIVLCVTSYTLDLFFTRGEEDVKLELMDVGTRKHLFDLIENNNVQLVFPDNETEKVKEPRTLPDADENIQQARQISSDQQPRAPVQNIKINDGATVLNSLLHVEQRFCSCLNSKFYSQKTDSWTLPLQNTVTIEEASKIIEKTKSNMRIFVTPCHPNSTCAPSAKISNSGYLMEYFFYEVMTEANPIVVSDSRNANFFYIPSFTSSIFRDGVDRSKVTNDPDFIHGVKQKVRTLINQQMINNFHQAFEELDLLPPSYYSGKKLNKFMTRAENVTSHMFTIITHDDGINFYFQHMPKEVLGNITIFATTSDWRANKLEDRNVRYNPSKDFPLICNYDIKRQSKANKYMGRDHYNCNPETRMTKLFFAGGLGDPGEPRYKILRPLLNRTDVTLHDRRFDHSREYLEELLNSKFCLAPRGLAVWSPRLMEYFWTGCIPVIISDQYDLPHSCFINWNVAAIIIEENDSDNIYDIINGISDDEYEHRCKYMNSIKPFTQLPDATVEAANSMDSVNGFSSMMAELYYKKDICKNL